MFPTRGNSVLDLVLSTLEKVKVTPGRNILDTPDHLLLHIELQFPTPRRWLFSIQRTMSLWNKTNCYLVATAIKAVPWEILKSGHVEDALDFFYACLDAVIKDYVPVKKAKSSKFPMWDSQETKFALNNNKCAWSLWKQYPNNITHNVFIHQRKLGKALLRRDYNNY